MHVYPTISPLPLELAVGMTETTHVPGDSPGANAETAYRLGYQETESFRWELEDIGASTEEEAIQSAHRSLSAFTDSARYANIILPQLRELAGYEDSGHGTYQEAPNEDCTHLLGTMVDYFTQGYVDGLLEGTEWE